IPRDPFTIQDAANTTDWSIEYAAGVAGVSAGSYNTPNNIWLLESEGPDKIDNVTSPGFPWPGAGTPPGGLTLPTFVDLVYDSTNGTRSQGSIFRIGGEMPPEERIRAFYIAVSQ
ncbi:MAG TPA: hypothetical protein VNA25_14600, partial [Phycisphaerae bacterium]|nr:hypothetical protein [Phycisphaerae bacterium]